MRRLLFALVFGLVGGGLAVPTIAAPEVSQHEVVRAWNDLALNAVRVTRASDADAARTYAILNVAVYDAVNGIVSADGPRKRAHALVPGPGPRQGNPQAAAAAAAHGVMVGLDPDRSASYDAQLAADLARLHPGRPRDLGVSWGRQVAQQALSSRANDGSRPVESQPAGFGPGVFRSEWSGVQYRNMRPFALADPGVFVPGPPPALDSLDYAAAFAEVALLGDAAVPAPDKLATFQFWSLPAGSVQPPGEWVKIALNVSGARRLSGGCGAADGAGQHGAGRYHHRDRPNQVPVPPLASHHGDPRGRHRWQPADGAESHLDLAGR
jgi:hypothetical protein